MSTQVSASLTAQNTFTDYIKINKGDLGTLVISGTWAGTITVQFKRLAADTAIDTELTFTANAFRGQQFTKTGYYRAGFKTGAYSSGTAVVELNA